MNVEAPLRPPPQIILHAQTLGFAPADIRSPALSGISFTLQPGEILAILGRHGSGRGSLRDLLLGLKPRGVVSGQLTRGTGIAYLPGADHSPFAGHRRVDREMLQLVAQRMRLSTGDAAGALTSVLSSLPGVPALDSFARKPGQLSPGELGLAALAVALAQNPTAIVADDPLASVDAVEAEALLGYILGERARRGFALLYLTGNAATAARLDGGILVLRDGKVVEQGIARRLAASASHPYTRALFRSVPRLQEPVQAPVQQRGEPLLEVHNFGMSAAADSDPAALLTFELRKGASLALIGMHGSGRRALTRAILGLDRAPQGRIIFDAVDVGVLSPSLRARLRRRLAYMAGDDTILDPRMTVLETVMEPMRRVRAGHAQIRSAAEALLLRVGLGQVPRRRLSADLEPVQRRRLQIARLLAASPQLAVLYEPLAGLGVLGQSLILDLLRDLRLHEGFGIFLVTGDFAIAQALADHALVIRDGRLVESGPVSELIRSPRQDYTRTLVDAAARRGQARPGALPSARPGG